MKYNSLQMRRRAARLGRRLYVLASYTYAKALTNGVSGFGGDPGIVYFPVVTDDEVDDGSANTDLRHNFSLSALYQLPFGNGQRFLGNLTGVPHAILGGWSVNTIFVAQSGYPLGMTMVEQPVGHGVRQPAQPGLRRHARRPDRAALVRHQLLRRAGGRRPSATRRARTLFGPGTLERRRGAVEEVRPASSSAPRSSTCSTTRSSRRPTPPSARRCSA